MRPTLLQEKKRVVRGKTLYRLYWPNEQREGGWATEGAVFPEESTAKVYGDAFLFGGEFLGGVFWGGVFWGGEFLGGEFLGGEFLGGEFLGGVFRSGEFRSGEFRGGGFWGGVFRGGEFWGGEFLGGEFWGGVFRGGEFWGGVFCDGVFRGGEFLGGVFNRAPAMAQRSDGYCFVIHPVDGELRVWAGCRNFSWAEAKEHWGNPEHPHHAESMRIIKFLKKQVKAREDAA